jgi:contractile injection system tape measure protein
MLHIIRQQYLDVEVNGTETDALLVTRRLADYCQHALAPALEKSLERAAPPNDYLYIERLDIDAGDLTLEGLERELVESVTRSLEKALQELVSTGRALSATPDSPQIRLRTLRQTIEEAFVYFLRTGSLPWSFRLPEGRSLEQVILESWREAAKSGASSQVVIGSVFPLLASATVRTRLIRQFSQKFLEQMFSLLSPVGIKALDEVFQVFRRAAPSLIDVKDFERRIWETAFTGVVTGAPLTARDIVSKTYRVMPVPPLMPVPPPRHAALTDLLESRWPGVTNTTSDRSDGAESIPPKALEVAMIQGVASEQLDVREGIYVDNAGLVLLHPFLPRFFEALGVAGEDKILKPDRALCLLHYLATGQPAAPEYDLILPKILCNAPLEAPVESNVGLTTAELEESAALLEAVIRHWEALRNTSPDGLRGTFLARPGKVSLRDDGDWLLQVESKAYDILLDQLPWGISMVKLPWMEKMMWVEWNREG